MEHLLGCPFWMDCSPILLNISYEKSEDFWSVESHKLAINPSLCQWLHMIGWLLVLLIGWLHIFILIDSLLLMMRVFFCFFKYNITPFCHPYITHWIPPFFLRSSWCTAASHVAHRGVSCDCWGNPPTGERLAADVQVSEVPAGFRWFMKFFFFWSFDEVFIWCWEITISGISLLWLYLGFMMIYENIEGLIGRRRTWARSLDRNGKAISPDLPNGHVEHWLCVYRMWWQILDLSDTILGWRLDG